MKHKTIISICFIFMLLLGSLNFAFAAEENPTLETAIVNLKTEGRVDPIGIDSPQPAFSWQMQSSVTGAAQAAYHITVQDDQLSTVWDSGVVESAQSSHILYEGEPLNPSAAYTWNVVVTDQNGVEISSETAAFETALMDTSSEAWDGAQWIGAGELALDAASKAVFRINADVQLQEGSSKVSFILGADDFRLKNPVFNPWTYAGESYVRVELDFANAVVNAYRYGFGAEENADVPFFTISENEELKQLLTPANQYEPHHVDIYCTGSSLTLTIDELQLEDAIVVNPLGAKEVNTYPNLNSIGFAADAGEGAVITNYRWKMQETTAGEYCWMKRQVLLMPFLRIWTVFRQMEM